MYNYKKNYDPPVEPREKEVDIESLKILTDFANMAAAFANMAMADRDSSKLGDKGDIRPYFPRMGRGYSRISRGPKVKRRDPANTGRYSCR